MIGLTDQSDYNICHFIVRLFIRIVGHSGGFDDMALITHRIKKSSERKVSHGIDEYCTTEAHSDS